MRDANVRVVGFVGNCEARLTSYLKGCLLVPTLSNNSLLADLLVPDRSDKIRYGGCFANVEANVEFLRRALSEHVQDAWIGKEPDL